MKALSGLLVGILFGLGLILSGMTNPAKVAGFLDLAGSWDPSLALVMGGAILIGLPAFYLAKQRSHSLLGGEISLPDNRQIDRELIAGAIVFGIGWGLSGYCPGPALTSLLTGGLEPVIFTLGMVGGILIHKRLS